MARIRQMTYRAAPGVDDAVETMSFGTLRRRNDRASQRADFHVLALVRDGTGEVFTDFESHTLRPATVVWIPPGVVHRWTDIDRLSGSLAVFVATAAVTSAARDIVARPVTTQRWTAENPAWRLIIAAFDHRRLETAPAATREPAGRELPRLLLSALLLRLDPPASVPADGDETFRRFRAAVEANFRTQHSVEYYARELGWSARTLSRSCQAATGRTAKQFITERLLLEAKRLLAYDRLTPMRCGQRLGFLDASNFSAFFLRNAGVRPGAWQAVSH